MNEICEWFDDMTYIYNLDGNACHCSFETKKAIEIKRKIKKDSKLYFHSPYDEQKRKEEAESFLRWLL